MPEQTIVIKTTETAAPRTTESLRYDLERLGVAPGDILLVHASLSSIGWVCGGAQSVVQALLDTLGPAGTLVMPAHTPDNTDPAHWQQPPVPKAWHSLIRKSMPAFEPLKTPSRGMGAIAECFRIWPGTLRSNHPQTSFCANGPAAGQITARHALTPQFGEDSPLGALYAMGARVLLLGVGFSRCSCLHLAETRASVMPKQLQGAAMLHNGERVWREFEDFAYGAMHYGEIGRRCAEQDGHCHRDNVGNARAWLCPVRGLVDSALKEMEKYFAASRQPV